MIERSWSILFVGLYNLWRESDRDSPACLQDVCTFLMSPLFTDFADLYDCVNED